MRNLCHFFLDYIWFVHFSCKSFFTQVVDQYFIQSIPCSLTHGSQTPKGSNSADLWIARNSLWRPAPMQHRMRGYPSELWCRYCSLSNSAYEPPLLDGSLYLTIWRMLMALMGTWCSPRMRLLLKWRSLRMKGRMIDSVLMRWGWGSQNWRRSA